FAQTKTHSPGLRRFPGCSGGNGHSAEPLSTRGRSAFDLCLQFVKPARQAVIEEILDGLAEIAARKRVDLLIKGVTMVEMLTPQDVSRITGLFLETLPQWRSKKIHLPYLKIGRLIRYDRRDVEAYLETCKITVSNSHRRQK